VSQSAQSFLPALLGRPAAAFALCRSLLLTGAVVGALNCALAGVAPVLAPGLFTTSAAVAAGMREVAPIMSAALVLHSSSMATEGLLLAGRDLKWLLVSYARNAAACFVTLAASQHAGWGLRGVWAVLIQFHATRLAQNAHRLYVSPASPLKSIDALTADED
jgi:Na+-driven multidrug efflux pump